MQNIKRIFIPIIIILLVSCNNEKASNEKETIYSIPTREYSVQSVLWQQNAAEYRALCYQAFNTAKYFISNLDYNSYDKKLAIITDIDETVLDNSPYDASLIALDKEYSKESWINWGDKKIAKPLPGAIGFFKYASETGFEIFYVSNRYIVQKEATLENLRKFDLPNVDEDHLLLQTNTSGKENRRQDVLKKYDVVLYLGDNLSDFSDLFDNKLSASRNSLVDSLSKDFGSKFIIFPNPIYGDWETKGIYEGNSNWSKEQKDSLRKAKLKVIGLD